ncbi:MAG: hypothetical protein IKH16_11940 [Selenomonadaceae bacterium]|nr:hypothetical protein [Selenomonadaceae bacterium]
MARRSRLCWTKRKGADQVEHDKIFNRAALDKLRSPEKLDTMIRIVGPVGWMGLVSLAVLCFAIVLWSVYGSFTEKAEGKGLIMDSAGLANITHMTGGKVTEIYVRTGNRVHRGQLVAHMEQPTREDIYSDYEGVVDEVMVMPGEILAAGSPICTVRLTQNKEELAGVFYVPVEKGKRVEPGMTIQLAPNGVDITQTGSLIGIVKSVSQYPISAEGVRKGLGNAQLAKYVLSQGGGAAVEVKFDLVKDERSESGYLWTSVVGKHKPITAGSFCTGFIVIEREPPIEKVFYKISQWLRSR